MRVAATRRLVEGPAEPSRGTTEPPNRRLLKKQLGGGRTSPARGVRLASTNEANSKPWARRPSPRRGQSDLLQLPACRNRWPVGNMPTTTDVVRLVPIRLPPAAHAHRKDQSPRQSPQYLRLRAGREVAGDALSVRGRALTLLGVLRRQTARRRGTRVRWFSLVTGACMIAPVFPRRTGLAPRTLRPGLTSEVPGSFTATSPSASISREFSALITSSPRSGDAGRTGGPLPSPHSTRVGRS